MSEIPVHVTTLHESEVPISRDDPMAFASVDMWLLHQSAACMRSALRWRYVWPPRSKRLTAQAQDYGRWAVQVACLMRSADERGRDAAEAAQMRKMLNNVTGEAWEQQHAEDQRGIEALERARQNWRNGDVWR